MKATLSILKILFLAILLAVNVIGFHYYFTPVAKDNLAYVPANGKLVFTINLKSISGKLFEEAIFNPDVFEKELITKDEKSLVFNNSTYGINPFGLVTFFMFPFQEQMVSGISLNLQNSAEFVREMEKDKLKSQTVDGVWVFQNDKNTFFVYDKAVVILLNKFSESENETLAVEVLQNDELDQKWDSNNDFQMLTQTGILKNTFVESYFRMIPNFMESLTINGNFESGSISLDGKVSMNNKIKLKDAKGFLTQSESVSREKALSVELNGKDFAPIINNYIQTIVDIDSDTSGKLKNMLNQKFNSLQYSLDQISLDMDFLSMGADLLSGKWFDPSYVARLELTKERSADSIYIDQLLRSEKMNNARRKLLLATTLSPNNSLKGQFYFHPSRFIENSDLNFAIKSMIDSFIIFEEIYLVLKDITNNEANFKGEVVFIDKEVHTLIQLRLLFKNLSSLI